MSASPRPICPAQIGPRQGHPLRDAREDLRIPGVPARRPAGPRAGRGQSGDGLGTVWGHKGVCPHSHLRWGHKGVCPHSNRQRSLAILRPSALARSRIEFLGARHRLGDRLQGHALAGEQVQLAGSRRRSRPAGAARTARPSQSPMGTQRCVSPFHEAVRPLPALPRRRRRPGPNPGPWRRGRGRPAR